MEMVRVLPWRRGLGLPGGASAGGRGKTPASRTRYRLIMIFIHMGSFIIMLQNQHLLEEPLREPQKALFPKRAGLLCSFVSFVCFLSPIRISLFPFLFLAPFYRSNFS